MGCRLRLHRQAQAAQRPEETPRTSSKQPTAGCKEQRAQAKPGGAKPGPQGDSRVMNADPDAVVDHRPERRAARLDRRPASQDWSGLTSALGFP